MHDQTTGRAARSRWGDSSGAGCALPSCAGEAGPGVSPQLCDPGRPFPPPGTRHLCGFTWSRGSAPCRLPGHPSVPSSLTPWRERGRRVQPGSGRRDLDDWGGRGLRRGAWQPGGQGRTGSAGHQQWLWRSGDGGLLPRVVSGRSRVWMKGCRSRSRQRGLAAFDLMGGVGAGRVALPRLTWWVESEQAAWLCRV